MINNFLNSRDVLLQILLSIDSSDTERQGIKFSTRIEKATKNESF